MNKLSLCILLLLALPTANIASAREVSSYFVAAPADAMPIISTTARLDMIDYFRSGLDTPTNNELRGRSRITAMSATSMDIEVSKSASVQMALVSVKKDTIIAVIETVKTPVADSHVRFFSTDWKEIATAMPDYTAFITKDNRKQAKGCDAPDMTFTTVRFDPDTNTFIFTDTSRDYYPDVDTPEIIKLMQSEIRMTFDGKKFKATR